MATAKRKPGRRDPRVPRGASTDIAKIERILGEVETEVALRLSDDPALRIGSAVGLLDADGEPVRLPVVLFEPRAAVGVTLPDGTRQEMQTEAIIQAGFSRWRPVTAFERLDDWSVRQTKGGVELWDHGGIWARARATNPDLAWYAAAGRLGMVLAVYGPRVGVRRPPRGAWTPTEQAAELRNSQAAGIVAAALVPWRPLSPPDDARWPGPSYDAATGRIEIARGPENEPQMWQLHTPGVGVEHGLILGGLQLGKTSLLRVLNLEAVCSGRFVIWPADPTGRHDLPKVWTKVADCIPQTPAETVKMLTAANAAIQARLDNDGYADPSPDRPGILITIDECQHVFAGNPEATALAERIVTDGGPAGVGLVVTSRGADLAYFGGSRLLLAGLGRRNRLAFGTVTGLDLLVKYRDRTEQV